MKYVYWKNRISNGDGQHGKQQYKNVVSRVHLADQYTNLRTACNIRIPTSAEPIRTENRAELPEKIEFCRACFK